jgi:hypothetical protein
MGIRGEIFSTKVMLQNRSYFFNVKENRMGDLYLNIVESKNKETGGFDRQSVILFADDLQEFLQGFDESLRVLEKAVREKRRSSGGESRGERRPPSAPKEALWKTEGAPSSGDRGARRVVVRKARPAGKDGEPRSREGGSGYNDSGPRSRDGGSGYKADGPRNRDGGSGYKDSGPRNRDGGSGYKDSGPRSRDGGFGGKGRPAGRDGGFGGKGRPAGREGGRDNGPSGAPRRPVVRRAWKKD